jgi:hypothetical protein
MRGVSPMTREAILRAALEGIAEKACQAPSQCGPNRRCTHCHARAALEAADKAPVTTFADTVEIMCKTWLSGWDSESDRGKAVLRKNMGRVLDAIDACRLGGKTARDIVPFPAQDPTTCAHEWEPHLWERGQEYCPHCASQRVGK